MNTPDTSTLAEQAMHSWYLSSRHDFIVNLAAKALAGRNPADCRILDAGCGSGGVTTRLLRKGYNVVACDMDEESIRQGLATGRLKDVHRLDVAQLPFEDNSFDLVVCSEVLEHVPDDAQALRSLLRVAKRDVLFSVPAHMYLWTQSDTTLGHRHRYSKADVRALIGKAGAGIVKVHAYGIMPAAGTLAYKALSKPPQQTNEQDVPNAMKFRVPPAIDKMLWALSSLELSASGLGLVPWGFAWWAIARKIPA